ncbi:MAG: hypothetical protein JWM95_1716 [Gemmatimonadetes bacterium]|nr:hypothetical protein [Gemmatimonadota bacterium]
MTTTERTPRSRAREILATALGVRLGAGCSCCVCGDSPFDGAGPRKKALGIGFSDWAACEAPTAPDLCTGCARLLGGRPGDVPPPPRTRSLAVVEGALLVLDYADVWGLLVDPPQGLSILSWATSKQRHHILYAEPCTPTHLRIGSDQGTITFIPSRDAPLSLAVATLRTVDAKGFGWCARDDILSGRYRPAAIARGASAWTACEAIIAPRRGDPVLDLLVAHAPTDDPRVLSPFSETFQSMIDPTDARAADLLVRLAKDSGYRSTHGKEFWAGVFARRVQRHAGRVLPVFVARMLADLSVAPHSSGALSVVEFVRETDDADATNIMMTLRERTQLLVALAYDQQQAAKLARPNAA